MDNSYVEKIQAHKENKIAGMHPGTKFLVLLLFSVCVFICNSFKYTWMKLPLLLVPWFGVLLILFAISGAFKKCLKACKKVAFIAAVIFVAQTFIVPGGEILFKWLFIDIAEAGFVKGFSLSMMVFDIAGIFVWLFNTTENKEIAQALEDAGVNYKVSYVFVSTFKMIDVLSDNSKTIMNAQKARGVETQGNLLVRAKAFVPSIIPLVLGAVTGAEERVLTLEARGFNVEGKKTRLLKIHKSGIEKPFTIFWVIVTVAIVAWRVVAWVI